MTCHLLLQLKERLQDQITGGRLVWILLALGMVTHFLWLDLPREVIFDEVHFGKFVNSYCCTGEYFFDIHPPHAKLLIAAGAKIVGYEGEVAFDQISEKITGVSPVVFRWLPALWGVLIPILIFGLIRQLGGGQATAFLGGLLVLFDNALTVQTRVMALDGLLLVGILGGLSAYLRAEKILNQGEERGACKWLILSGVLCGLAVGTKFTGLAGLGLVGILVAVKLLSCNNWSQWKVWIKAGLAVLLVAVVVYGAGWVAHWWLLDQPGSGDAWGKPDWSGSLIPSLWQETWDMHKTMLNANYNLKADHPYESKWYEWPIMKRPVFYWSGKMSEDKAGGMYFLGNPIVWWGGSGLFVVAFLAYVAELVGSKLKYKNKSLLSYFNGLFVKRKQKDKRATSDVRLWIPLVGFLLSYIPLMRVPRALFMYHFLAPLLFGLLFGVLWLEKVGLIKRQRVEMQMSWYWILIGVLLGLFIYFLPLTYGWLVPMPWFSSLFWFASWR